MRWRDHLQRGVSVLEMIAPGILARCEAREVCFTAGGFVLSPPGFELLVPALRVCRAAYPNMSSPYSGVSVDWHGKLLLGSTTFPWCAVRSTNRLIGNIGPANAEVK